MLEFASLIVLSFSPEDENVTVIELDVASLQLSVIFASRQRVQGSETSETGPELCQISVVRLSESLAIETSEDKFPNVQFVDFVCLDWRSELSSGFS